MKNSLILMVLSSLPMLAAAEGARQVSQIKDMYPGLSPDGHRIVFQSNRSGSMQVWIMNDDGSEPQQLTHANGEGAETPVWSPDGRKVAYAAYVAEGNNDVFLMNPDGSGQKRITHGPGYDGHPHWTADGKRLVFNSDRDTPRADAGWSDRWHDIWSVDSDGGNPVKHTDCRSVCTYGSLSPDGRRVLFRKVDATSGLNWALEAIGKNSEIYIADANGTNVRSLAAHPAFDGWPRWSPDGEWVIFASNRAGPALTGQLWRVRADGSELQQLTRGDWGHAQPAWWPGGDKILAYRFQETPDAEQGGIVVIDVKPLP
jgi:TolB protein